MPILNILVNQPCTPDQKSQLLNGVSQAVVESIRAPLTSVRVSLQTIAPDDAMVAGEMGQPMAQVIAHLLPGRTEADKQALIASLSRALTDSIAISDQNSRIIILDVPTTDMGVAGGISAKMAGR